VFIEEDLGLVAAGVSNNDSNSSSIVVIPYDTANFGVEEDLPVGMLDRGSVFVPTLAHGDFEQFVDGAVGAGGEVKVLGFAELGSNASPLPLTFCVCGLDVQTLHEILMDDVCVREGKVHQILSLLVPFVNELVVEELSELLAQVFVVNARSKETPSSTTSAEIEHGTTLPLGELLRILELIVLLEEGEESIVLLATILAKARRASSVQTVRVERQATFLDDQDTLCTLAELGVTVEEIASDDACTHSSTDDDDVVALGGCLLRSKLEPQLFECPALLAGGGLAFFNELEDETLILGISDLDDR
jgi:hypothetical protein